ncbi:GNAT family N-acetyltransferase [uncultured Eudoraea sp.]|uniref:GNAT family N-acetyltransferase n=1 Tax=uncultured Eudoraea sp. TaxID=1035614 RepID=UPI00260736CD|nr:GNAT family N-acetyltransferase [uncultured Eudoraea sp.]
MEEISIRPAIISDLEILLNFEQELIKAERPYDETIRKDPVCYYDLKRMILDNEVAVFVAEVDNRVVSCGTAIVKQARPYLNHKEYVNFGFMYTLPQYRGLGINKLILNALRTWSLSRGFHEMRLTVYRDNIPAIKAYEKAGFVNHLIEMRIPENSVGN